MLLAEGWSFILVVQNMFRNSLGSLNCVHFVWFGPVSSKNDYKVVGVATNWSTGRDLAALAAAEADLRHPSWKLFSSGSYLHPRASSQTPGDIYDLLTFTCRLTHMFFICQHQKAQTPWNSKTLNLSGGSPYNLKAWLPMLLFPPKIIYFVDNTKVRTLSSKTPQLINPKWRPLFHTAPSSRQTETAHRHSLRRLTCHWPGRTGRDWWHCPVGSHYPQPQWMWWHHVDVMLSQRPSKSRQYLNMYCHQWVSKFKCF